jgi:hypothetical protein
MDSGRMPACDTVLLAGSNIASGCEVLIGRNSNDYYPSMQEGIKGNRCDHDKNNFKRPSVLRDAKRRPHVLEEAKRRVYDSINDNFRYPEFAGLFFHKAESPSEKSSRRRRSERVEGIFSLALPFLLHSLNLQRMACGFYDNRNNFIPYDYSYLENKTEQSSSRIKREMAILQSEEIIKVNTQRELTQDGVWRTKSVTIEFTDKIFRMLDLIPEFLQDRETSAIKFHEKQSRLDKNRQKKENFRKPFFSSTIKKAKQEVGNIGGIANKIGKPIPKPTRGRGQEIKELYGNLIARGSTPQEAAEIIRTKYPPPH